MKQFLFTILFSIGITISFAQVGAYSVGDVVDDFTVTDTYGNVHNLYEITASGKYVVLDFFFTTCIPCQQTQKHFNHLHDKYGCNEGEVYTLSISGHPYDNDQNVNAFEEAYGGQYKHSPAVSPEGNGAAVTSNFGISAFPTYCIVGPDNKLAVRDIWPIGTVTTFENAFPADFNPEPMECTEDGEMGLLDLNGQVFSLYPSVSNGQINVDLAQAADSKISIYNMAGQIVYSNSYKAKKNIQLNLNLNPGVYILKVNTTDNKTSTQRFIIK